jgi:TP901 family phage tail tape measure protein
MAAGNTIATLLIKIGVDIQDMTKGTKKVESHFKRMETSGKRTASALRTSFAVIGTAAIAGLGVALKKGIAFENQMVRVKAVTKGTEDQFKQLQSMAFKLSNTMGISSTKVAGAMEKLARFGFDANKILKTLPSILEATRASGEDLDTVLRVTEGLLSEFGLTADHTTEVVDTLTAVSMKTRANFSRMGEAFKYSAGTAKQLGVKMYDLAAVTGLLINAGVEGGMAGRAMRRVMIRLSSPTGAAAKEMKSLGVVMDNGKGKMKSMTAIIAQFIDKTKGFSDLKKFEILNKIFGTEGITPMLALMEQGPEKIRKLAEEIEKSGGVTKSVSEKMAESAEQSLNRFNESINNLQIRLALKLLPALTKVVDKVNDLFDAFDKLDPKTQDTIIAIGGFALAILAIGGAIAILGPAIAGVTALFAFLATPLGAIVGIIGLVIWAFNQLGITWDWVVNTIKTGNQRIANDFINLKNRAFKWGRDMLKKFGDGISSAWGWLKTKISGIATWIKDHLGFSVPKAGPLKDADKWMPDMMDLFSKGIDMGTPKLEMAVNTAANTLAGSGGSSYNNTVNVYPRSTSMTHNQFVRSLNQVAWMRGGGMI